MLICYVERPPTVVSLINRRNNQYDSFESIAPQTTTTTFLFDEIDYRSITLVHSIQIFCILELGLGKKNSNPYPLASVTSNELFHTASLE